MSSTEWRWLVDRPLTTTPGDHVDQRHRAEQLPAQRHAHLLRREAPAAASREVAHDGPSASSDAKKWSTAA